MMARSLESRSFEFEVPLALLRRQVADSNLLPKIYERYRSLLADALCFFLRRLSPVRLRQILTEQLRLAQNISTAERVVALLEHIPALHKLGQVVARDHRLNLTFRTRLQKLESMAPRIPAGQVLRSLEREFKNWRRAGIEVGPQLLAEGSVGMVLPFVWRSRKTGPRHGVFKLLKPGICRKLEEDLKVLSLLGEFLDEDCVRLGLPALDYRETFNTIRELLLHEIRLDEEQQNLAEAAAMYESTQGIIIPKLFPFCSSRLTAMERVFGEKIPDAGPLKREGLDRGRAARLIVRGLLAMPIVSIKPSALFHADPHGGNFLITPNNEVAVLDWSLSGRLEKNERIEMVHLFVGAFTSDAQEMERALGQLSQRKPDRLVLRQIVNASLSELRPGVIPGLTWLTRLLDALVLRAGLRPSSNLLLFRKSLLSIAGLVADLIQTNQASADELVDEIVMQTFLERWFSEWPSRAWALPNDRSFGTHLAATDLIWLMWSTPMTYARWYTQRKRLQGSPTAHWGVDHNQRK